MSTYYDLPVGARLAYMHRFSGMYNCVSQVAFFHNENYERRVPPKHRSDITDSIQELPLLSHMHPEIPIVFEDERPYLAKPYWMLLPGRVYLVRADGVPLLHTRATHMLCALQAQ